MPFGEPRDADRKPVHFLDEPDELVGVFEAAVGLAELARAARRIAAQRQDVGDPERARLSQHARGVFTRRVDARHVRHGGEALLALYAIDDRQRRLAGAAAGAVGDRAEVRLQRAQRGDRLLEQRPFALGRLGRKKLEGNHRPARLARGGKDIAYETHVQISYRNEDRRMRARPPLRRGGGPRPGGYQLVARTQAQERGFQRTCARERVDGLHELDPYRDRMGLQGRHVHVDGPRNVRSVPIVVPIAEQDGVSTSSCSNTSRFTSTSPRWRSDGSARAFRRSPMRAPKPAGQIRLSTSSRAPTAICSKSRNASTARPHTASTRASRRSGSGGYWLF